MRAKRKQAGLTRSRRSANGYRRRVDSEWAVRKEARVKRISAPTILTSAFAIVLVLGIVSTAQADEPGGCSNATLRGSFGFTSTGTLLAVQPPLAGPFAEVGRQTFDGEGNTDATA